MSRPLTAAIDIGSNTVRVVVGELRDDKINLLARSSSQSQGVRHGFITNKSEAYSACKKAIRLTEKQTGREIEDIYVTAGGGPLSTQIVSASVAVSHGNGQVTDADIDNALRRCVKKSLSTNQRNIDSIILGYKLDGTETVSEPLGMEGKKLELESMMFNYASQNIDATEDVLDQVEVNTADFFPSVVAASIVSLTTIDRKVGCVLVDIGSDSTQFIVYEQDSPLHVGYIDQGSDSITQAIALEHQISVSEAEIIKQGGPTPAVLGAEKVRKTVNKAVTNLFKLLDAELKVIDKSANLPGGVVLCGGGALLPGIEQIARDTLKVPARKAVVKAFKRRDADERELPWASVYGLAIHALEQERYNSRSPVARMIRRAWHTVRTFFV